MKHVALIAAAIVLASVRFGHSSAEDEVRMCTMEYRPVCSVSGITFGNLCQAGSAQIAYPGECDPYRASAETYLRNNISSLAPHREILGGKFLVTEISWKDAWYGTGIRSAEVKYEDGHNAFSTVFVMKSSSTGTVAYPLVNRGETVSLKKGQKVIVLQTKTLVTLSDMQDSTCPAGVQCIWAGEKSVSLAYRKGFMTREGKNLYSAFGTQLELKGSDYSTYADFLVK